MKYGAYIRYYTGISQEKYSELVYECGVRFINMVEEDQRVIAQLERSTIFWNWYKRQFEILTKEFIDINGIDNIQHYSSARVREVYERYVRKLPISTSAKYSYLYLVTEVLRTGRSNQQKEQANINLLTDDEQATTEVRTGSS